MGQFAMAGVRKDETGRVQVVMCDRGEGHGEKIVDAVDFEYSRYTKFE